MTLKYNPQSCVAKVLFHQIFNHVVLDGETECLNHSLFIRKQDSPANDGMGKLA